MLNQILGKQKSIPNLHSTSSQNSNLTITNSNLSSISSVGSITDIEQIPSGSQFTILTTSKFTLSLRLLDKILYLRTDDSGSNITPLRGYLCIEIKKPVRISHILLQLNGTLNVKFFPINIAPDPNSSFVKNKFISIFSQSRSWQYKQNDKVLDTDYFTIGSFAYPFQFLIPNDIPETMSNVFGSTSYSISVTVNPVANSITKISQIKTTAPLPIQVVQCDTESMGTSTTASDALSLGKWRNLLYYKIAVSNRQVAIGGYLKFYIKVLPIHSFGYILKSLKIYLDQITEYHVSDLFNESEFKKYHANLAHTETILLEEINFDIIENDIQCWELDTFIKKVHIKHNVKDPKSRKEVILVPTTNEIENKICHFRVSHKVRVSLSVEEITQLDENVINDTSDIISSFSMRTRSQSIDKSLLNTRAEKADNAMIRKLAKLVMEPELKKNKVELVLEAEVEILKGESVDGKMPPPTYLDAQHQKNNDGKFNATGSYSYDKFNQDVKKQKQKQKPQLNFIVPPAYEEIEEQLQPPPYLNSSLRNL
ncbi:hypothetical protein C6P40_002936 [Pichia californica]|uniref:Arrestin C-terminal-like domain-containing protein n=1 Tax=Pichia californica TaxID=460514 RepID=A0A9P6WQZ8_9ASCO|nr:hypothetical protein C6P42_002795 [[Candida] californica]KAG0690443.1 hypothetical protein C6P40_002936 [[Candida] californica]